MSGKYAIAGKRALRGIMVATDVFKEGVELQVIVKDSGSNVEEAVKALDEMVRQDGVSFVVGLVPGTYIEGIGRTIESLRVPTLVFPVSEQEGSGNSYLVTFSYNLKKQAQVLAKYAVHTVGIRTFGILYPRNHIGKLFNDAFVESLKQTGGRVTYAGSYDSELREISKEIGWIKSTSPQAIFIPDGATRSGALIKKLKRELTLGDVLFLGPNTWNSSSFLRAVGNEVDGDILRVLFTDFFHPEDLAWVDFSDTYEKAFEEEPGSLEYQVYEGVNLLLNALKSPILKREELIERLLAQRNNQRFDITKGMNGGLEIVPKPIFLTIKGGEIIPLNERP